jgi:hypothetical protein
LSKAQSTRKPNLAKEGAPDWAGGAFLDGTAQRYEILFQKLKLKLVTGYEFARDLDDLLTEFMLLQLGHPKGQQSPKFSVLVAKCDRQDVLRTKDVRKLFNKVHSLRTKGLHRLEREIPDPEIFEIAQNVYEFCSMTIGGLRKKRRPCSLARNIGRYGMAKRQYRRMHRKTSRRFGPR